MSAGNSEDLWTPLQEDAVSPAPAKSGFLCSVWHSAVQDFISYLNEYVYYCGYSLDKWMDSDNAILTAQQHICSVVTSADIVIFAKPGCGYCARAKSLLQSQYHNTSNPTFTENVVDVIKSTSEGTALAKALIISLQLGDMTFPQIVIRGKYIGGSDEFSDLVAAGQLPILLKKPISTPSTNYIISWEESAIARAGKPDLLTVPHMRGSDGAWYPRWPWYCFHFCLYSNLVRYISIIHLCLMIPAYYLYMRGTTSDIASAHVLIWILLCDLCAICLFGPSPLSISGTISTYFGWRVRGNATSSIPYKVVWIFYIASLIPLFAKKNYSGLSTALLAYITNSTFLVVFRF